MSKTDWNQLTCGCIIVSGRLNKTCPKHYNDQPVQGDPLWNWLIKESQKKTGLELIPRKLSNEKPVAFEFFNDGKKDIIVRTTPHSSQDNPQRIKRLELKTLYLRPKGFMKLWDYDDSYVLLVE